MANRFRIRILLLIPIGALAQIDKGAQVSIRAVDPIDSTVADVAQKFRCTLAEPAKNGSKVFAPKGADCFLRIVGKEDAGKLTGSAQLKLELSEIRIGSDWVSVSAEPLPLVAKGKGKATALRSGIGAGIGAGVGGLLGGGKGAAIGASAGAVAGAASSILTEGPSVKVPAEAVLEFLVK